MRSLNQSHILIVEDEESYRSFLAMLLKAIYGQVDEAGDGSAAINLINRTTYDLVLTDLGLPGINGMEVLRYTKENSPSTVVIVLTGQGDITMAVEAMKLGAFDFLTKPVDEGVVRATVARALDAKRMRTSLALMEQSLVRERVGGAAIGTSAPWLALLETAKRFAENEATILITGETGAGKEVLARYIHAQGERNEKPFVTVDCGSIPQNLIESELFGYAKGAYTGAESSKEGLVEIAHGGTLFLDEIGDIDLLFQQKVLKFLETRSFRRVGETTTRTVDVRLIAATNKDLQQEMEEGRFRNDLWYRLNVLRLEIPPLRERKEDIIPIAEFFLKQFSRGRVIAQLTPEAARALQEHWWPGNVRELRSMIQRSLAVSDDGQITAEDLGLEASDALPTIKDTGTRLTSLSATQKDYIAQVLEATNWNISRAAKILQIGRNTLYKRMEEFGIKQRK